MAPAMDATGKHESNDYTSESQPSRVWSLPEVRLYQDEGGRIRIADDPDTYGSYSLKRMATTLEANPSFAKGLNRSCQAEIVLAYEDEVGRRVRVPVAQFTCIHDDDGFYITSAVDPAGETIKDLHVAKRDLLESTMEHDPDDPSMLEALYAQALDGMARDDVDKQVERAAEELSIPAVEGLTTHSHESGLTHDPSGSASREDSEKAATLVIGGSPVLPEEACAVWFAVGIEGLNRRIEADKNGQTILGKLWTDAMIDHVSEREPSPSAQRMALAALIAAKASPANTKDVKLREYVRGFLERAVDTPEQFLEKQKDRLHLQTLATRLLGPRETAPEKDTTPFATVSGAKSFTVQQLTQKLRDAKPGDLKQLLPQVSGIAASAFNSLKGTKRDENLQNQLRDVGTMADVAKSRLTDVILDRTDREKLRGQINHVAHRAAKRLSVENTSKSAMTDEKHGE